MTTTTSAPTAATTVTGGALFDIIEAETAALRQRVNHFLATGEGKRAELKREVERLFGMRDLTSKAFQPITGHGQPQEVRSFHERSGDLWEALVALKHSF